LALWFEIYYLKKSAFLFKYDGDGIDFQTLYFNYSNL